LIGKDEGLKLQNIRGFSRKFVVIETDKASALSIAVADGRDKKTWQKLIFSTKDILQGIGIVELYTFNLLINGGYSTTH
jgi:hypothetical protein